MDLMLYLWTISYVYLHILVSVTLFLLIHLLKCKLFFDVSLYGSSRTTVGKFISKISHLFFRCLRNFFMYPLARSLTAGGGPCRLEWLSLSGCVHITDASLAALKRAAAATLTYSDLSGCARLSGGAIANFTAACSRLGPENLAYCSRIGQCFWHRMSILTKPIACHGNGKCSCHTPPSPPPPANTCLSHKEKKD